MAIFLRYKKTSCEKLQSSYEEESIILPGKRQTIYLFKFNCVFAVIVNRDNVIMGRILVHLISTSLQNLSILKSNIRLVNTSIISP